MATVGEMVKHSGSLTPLRKTQYARQCGRMDIANVLHHLGIWDAEVLEFELRRDHEDSDMLWWECDQKHSAAGSSVFSETFDGPEAEYVGQRVRVIVLPAKEE